MLSLRLYHALQNFKNGKNLWHLLKNCVRAVIIQPPGPLKNTQKIPRYVHNSAIFSAYDERIGFRNLISYETFIGSHTKSRHFIPGNGGFLYVSTEMYSHNFNIEGIGFTDGQQKRLSTVSSPHKPKNVFDEIRCKLRLQFPDTAAEMDQADPSHKIDCSDVAEQFNEAAPQQGHEPDIETPAETMEPSEPDTGAGPQNTVVPPEPSGMKR